MRRHEVVQLVALLAAFVVAGYAAQRLLAGHLIGTGAWFVGSAVVHDLGLFPLYALLDLALVALLRRRPGLAAVHGVAWLNYLRVPVAVSAVLLLVWSPLILRVDPGVYTAVSGLTPQPYLPRWLAVTAVLLVASALLFGMRVLRQRPRERGDRAPARR